LEQSPQERSEKLILQGSKAQEQNVLCPNQEGEGKGLAGGRMYLPRQLGIYLLEEGEEKPMGVLGRAEGKLFADESSLSPWRLARIARLHCIARLRYRTTNSRRRVYWTIDDKVVNVKTLP
jgi:hypothetical protein